MEVKNKKGHGVKTLPIGLLYLQMKFTILNGDLFRELKRLMQ